MAFGWINWAMLSAFILGTTLAGHLLKGKVKSLDGVFLGGHGLPRWAVSASIMVSQPSAVTIIAVPGAVFRERGDLLFLQDTLFGFVVAKLLMGGLRSLHRHAGERNCHGE